MEENKTLINELVGKKVVIKTHGGSGIKDVVLVEGNYIGTILAVDNSFVKLEYVIRKFQSEDTHDTVLINLAYIITAEEFRQRVDQA